jgi:TolB-like protein/Flp pilus assembly protein TadD
VPAATHKLSSNLGHPSPEIWPPISKKRTLDDQDEIWLDSRMSLFSELKRRNVVRVAIGYLATSWLLIQIVETLYPVFGLPDVLLRIIVVLLAIGFPLTLLISWLYELTPDGLMLEKDVDRQASITHHTGKRLDRVIIVILSLALGYFAIDKFLLDPARDIQIVDSAREEGRAESLLSSYGDRSIAVLPFTDMSPEKDQEYFSDGITEELLNLLANVRDLRVISRTSAFSFKGKNLDVRTIARQLNVRHILEGSVRKSGDKIRITAQLIDASSDTHLWSMSYDRELGDVFAIQDEIASAITAELEVSVLGGESSRTARNSTENFGAYDYYLLGLYQRERRNPEALEKSIELFKTALELDDQFAPGYTALASSYLFQAYFTALTPEEAEQLARPLLSMALDLDPDLAEAHLTLGSIRLMLRDFPAADAAFIKAIELQPNFSGAWSNLGFSMVLQSRLNEAEAAYRESEVLDPLNASLIYNMGALMFLTGRYEDGMEAFNKVLEISPDRIYVAAAAAHWSSVYGQYEDAARWLFRKPEDDSNPTRILLGEASLYSALGMWVEFRETISRVQRLSPGDTRLLDPIANAFFLTGDHEQLAEFVAQEYEKVDTLESARYSPTNRARYFWHGHVAVLEDDLDQAIRDFTEAAGGAEGIAAATYDEITWVKHVAYVYQRQGRVDEASELLTTCLRLARNAQEQGWGTPTIHYRTAQILALQGDSDNAIVELTQAINKGWLADGPLERDPLWTGIRDDVRFQALSRQVSDDLATKRANVSELVSIRGD